MAVSSMTRLQASSHRHHHQGGHHPLHLGDLSDAPQGALTSQHSSLGTQAAAAVSQTGRLLLRDSDLHPSSGRPSPVTATLPAMLVAVPKRLASMQGRTVRRRRASHGSILLADQERAHCLGELSSLSMMQWVVQTHSRQHLVLH